MDPNRLDYLLGKIDRHFNDIPSEHLDTNIQKAFKAFDSFIEYIERNESKRQSDFFIATTSQTFELSPSYTLVSSTLFEKVTTVHLSTTKIWSSKTKDPDKSYGEIEAAQYLIESDSTMSRFRSNIA